MDFINSRIKWIMVLVGVITCSMLLNTVSPNVGLLTLFGATIDGPLTNIVVRNWGALIGLTGGMLIYAAFKPPLRSFVISVACISKFTFIMLVLIYGQQFIDKAAMAVVFDGLVVVIFLLYLLGQYRTRKT